MHSIEFEGSKVIGKPSDMTDEQCSSVYAAGAVDESGFPYTVVCMSPNLEDIKAMQEGRPLFIKFIGVGLRPFAVWTLDEKGEIN